MTENRYIQWGIGLIAFAGFILFFRWGFERAWLPVLIIPVLLIGYHYRTALSPVLYVTLVSFILAVALIYATREGQLALNNIKNPPEFDIQQFWLHARIGVQGLNFYEPEHARSLAQELFNPSSAMMHEFYFWYPPPTIFFFIWMGWFDIQTATAIWSGTR